MELEKRVKSDVPELIHPYIFLKANGVEWTTNKINYWMKFNQIMQSSEKVKLMKLITITS